MVNPIAAICADRECLNNANGSTVLCCAKCGRCGEHSHQDCEENATVHGCPDSGNPLVSA